MKTLVLAFSLLAIEACQPAIVPGCDVNAYLANHTATLVDCGTTESSAPEGSQGMTQWRCIREAIAARREFRTTIKNRPGRHASMGDAEIRGLFVGGTYGIFLGEPGSPEWVGPFPSFTFIGGVSGSSAVITQVNPNLNVIPRSVLTIFPSPGAPHEVEFPPPEPGAFSDLLKVSETIADLRNEPWCRVP